MTKKAVYSKPPEEDQQHSTPQVPLLDRVPLDGVRPDAKAPKPKKPKKQQIPKARIPHQ